MVCKFLRLNFNCSVKDLSSLFFYGNLQSIRKKEEKITKSAKNDSGVCQSHQLFFKWVNLYKLSNFQSKIFFEYISSLLNLRIKS